MRSALTQALDIVGPDADPAQTVVLACTIADLMWARAMAGRAASPAWLAAVGTGDGPGRVRAILATALPSFLLDGTEPEPVLRRLGLVPPSRRGPAAHDR